MNISAAKFYQSNKDKLCFVLPNFYLFLAQKSSFFTYFCAKNKKPNKNNAFPVKSIIFNERLI